MVINFLNTKLFVTIYWLVMVILLISSRWIYKSQYLFHNDSVQFALALNEFDVIKHQPHPPGYIVYIWFGKIINLFITDSNTIFIVLSIMASIVGLIAIYYLAYEVFGKSAGFLTMLFYITNASIWFHGMVAEVYIVEVAITLVILLFLYKFWRKGNVNLLLIAIGLLGILGGVRQTAELFILPVTIYVIISQRKIFLEHWKYITVVFLATNLIWFIPLMYFSGGVIPYFKSLSLISSWVVDVSLKANALIKNSALLWQTIKQSAFIYLPILFLASLPFIAAESKSRFRINMKQVWFWFWVIVPGLLILQLTLMRNPGYALLPIIVLLFLGSGAIVLITDIGNQYYKNLGTLVSYLLVVTIIFIQIYGFFTISSLSLEYMSASKESVTRIDDTLNKLFPIVSDNFSSEDTIVYVTGDLVFYGVRHLQQYLPEYDIYSYRPQALSYDEESVIWHIKGASISEYITKVPIDKNIKRIVLWGASGKVPKNELIQSLYSFEGLRVGFIDVSKPKIVEQISEDVFFTKFDFYPNEI